MISRFEAILLDTGLALRGLTRRKAIAALSVLTLAIGLSSTMTAFSIVDSLLLRPHPFPDLERLVALREYRAGSSQEQIRLTAADFLDMKREIEAFDGVAAYRYAELNVSGDGAPESVRAFYVSEDWFQMLGVGAARGRVLVRDDAREGSARVTVLTWGLWQRRFGSDPSVVGSEVFLNGAAHTVVGVMPSSVYFPRGVDVFVPLTLTAAEQTDRTTPYLLVVARMRAGVSFAESGAELERFAARLAERHPETHRERTFRLLPLREEQYRYTAPMFGMLQAASFLVLLLAAANVSNLVLVSRLSRSREIALRAALGARRARLFRQFFLECLALGAIALVVALPLSYFAIELVRDAMPGGIAMHVSGWREIRLDRESLGMGLALSVLLTLALSSAGLAGVRSAPLASSLAGGSRGAAGSERRTFRALLAGAQMALALALLSGAFWLLRGFERHMSAFQELEPRGILAGRIALPKERYPGVEEQTSFFSRLLSAASEVPSVTSAAIVANLPASNVPNEEVFFAVAHLEPATDAEMPRSDLQVVGGDFFEVFRVPLLRGRVLERSDDADAPNVLVVSETWARRYLPDSDPIGRRIRFGARDADGAWYRITGVVSDVKQNWFDPEPRPILYVSYLQVPRSRLRLAVRSSASGYELLEPLREKLASIDPHQALAEPTTLEDEIADSLAPLRILGFLLLSFAGIALTLSATGVYGVVSTNVSRRTREFGLRMALGARRAQVLKQVLCETLRLAALAMVVALPATFGLNLVLARRLFGLVAVSPLSLAAMGILLVAIAMGASYVPARTATRLDPVEALRWE
jgi:putative ABC transport system permease protein